MTRLFLPHQDGKIGQSLREKDQVALLAWSNTVQTIRCILSMRPASGGEPVPIVIDLTTTSNRLTSSAVVVIQQDGEIDGGAIFTVGASGLTQRGMCYAQVAQLGGRANLFMAGYVYSGHAPRYGEIEEPGPAGGQGQIKSIVLGDPAANTEYTTQVAPTGSFWRLRGFFGQLVTGAGVANRELTLRVSVDGNGTSTGGVASEIQTASLTVDYIGANPIISSGVSASLAGGAISIGIPDVLLVGGSGAIAFVTENLQAADNWGNGLIALEEWVVPN